MSFFKAYDMRGTFGVDFDLDTVYRVGLNLPRVVGGKHWLVGRDARVTSEAMRDALVSGLLDAGVEVTDLGLCSTPMVYFFTGEENFDGSVMITASHNPPGDNGLKVSRATALPVGYADGLDKLEKLVEAVPGARCSVHSAQCLVHSAGVRTIHDALNRYIAWQKSHGALSTKHYALSTDRDARAARVAIDCSNGMASLFAKELFPGAILLNDRLDGTFPAHSPNPLKAESREQLARCVRENHLDCGVIFDGDADRAMFVDENGDFVQPDYLVPVVAKATAEEFIDSSIRRFVDSGDSGNSGNSRDCTNTQIDKSTNRRIDKFFPVIHDVRTSRGATECLKSWGFEPVMVPVGHAFAKPILRKVGAICGGELAGHYYFKEFHGCDSGALAALRVLGEIAAAKARGETFSEMMKPISGRYANSGELNYRVEDKDAAIARALAVIAEKFPREVSRSTMDGVRIDFAEGWVSIRKSNTEPYLRLLVECDTRERLADWTRTLEFAIIGG